MQVEAWSEVPVVSMHTVLNKNSILPLLLKIIYNLKWLMNLTGLKSASTAGLSVNIDITEPTT